MAEIFDWCFKGIAVWISVSILIVATGWYFGTTLRDYCPRWWRRNVVGRAPGKSRL